MANAILNFHFDYLNPSLIQKWKQRIDLKNKLGTEGEKYFCFYIAIIIFIIILILIIMVIITWNTLQPEEEHEELVQKKIKWVSRIVTWEFKLGDH